MAAVNIVGLPEIMEVVAANDVEIVIDVAGTRVWVNVDGVCRFRAERSQVVRVVDGRRKERGR